MKKIIALTIVIAAAMLIVACNGKKQEETQSAKKALVIYYSQTGTTKAVAEAIQALTDADIVPIELEEPYDGDFGATIARVQKEREEGVLPELKELDVDVAAYDVVYLGYPIWFGTYAPAITALVETFKFEGKLVVPFCTFGSGGLEVSVKDLRTALPKADVLDGYGVRTARIEAMPAEVERFLKENGLIEGEVEALPAFSESQPVGEAEKNIFDIACSNYQFPLGNPVTFATREMGDATEYKFAVDNQTTIYVVKTQEGDEIKAEFTKVVR